MKRKFIAIMMMLAMILCLSACGSDSFCFRMEKHKQAGYNDCDHDGNDHKPDAVLTIRSAVSLRLVCFGILSFVYI